ncbi:MAG: DUF885 family protein, partial [Burkholderiales bacterium]|nr:DUF885 family protein [Burkholderiales bacterium]
LKKMPASFSEADKARLSAAMRIAIAKKIVPAYQKLARFVKNDYAPQGRTEVGLWALPQGDLRYAYQAKTATTTNLTPEEIHQIGLAEVARLEAEMLKVAQKLGYADVAALREGILKNTALYPKSRQEIVDLYSKYTEQTYSKLPQLFGRLPKAKVEVIATEEWQEMGAYQDPYNYYGHLQEEMKRAIRLVVDTGLHYKKWSRQQVVDFFHAHSGMDEINIQSETDRYIAWPAQALTYKIGQMKISQLRQYARTELGDKFDIRAFHDVVLGGGALPLDVLDKQVKAWVASQKATLAAK